MNDDLGAGRTQTRKRRVSAARPSGPPPAAWIDSIRIGRPSKPGEIEGSPTHPGLPALAQAVRRKVQFTN